MRALKALPLLVLLAALAGLVGAQSAYADDGGARPGPSDAKTKDFLAQLTDEERSFLQKRVKGWAQLPPQKQQMIARNVLRMRNMSAEQRKRFSERMERMRGKDKRWDRVRDHGARMLVDRGLAHAARKRLGRSFEGQLRRRDISDHVFERSFGRVFWDKVRQSAFIDGKPPAPDTLPAGFPERLVKRYGQMHARYAATEDADQRKRMTKALGWTYASMVSAKLRHELAKSDVKGTDGYIALAAKKVQQTWPREFAASLEDPEALVRTAENEEVKRSLRRLLRRDGKLMREEAVLVVKLVERWAAQKKKDEAAGSDADAVIQRVLREDLKLPADMVKAMPPRSEPEKRAAWYMQALRRYFGHRGGGPRGAGMEGRKGRPGRGMGMRMAKPEGVSDEAWGHIQQAVREGMRNRRPPQKPDAVDQATWDKAMSAWKKRLEAMKERWKR